MKIKGDHIELINGPVGKLEVCVSEGIAPQRNAFAVICHPHPLYGGTMQNKVVTTLVKTFQSLGVNTVRFNFRGVGQSEGKFDHGNGEIDDALAVINWMQREQKKNEIWLAGFSFGAYIAAKTASQLPITQLVTVAPPVNHFHMELIPPIHAPWIVVQGELDEVVPANDVYAWIETREPKPTLLKFPQAGHYFHGLLLELRERIAAAITNAINDAGL